MLQGKPQLGKEKTGFNLFLTTTKTLENSNTGKKKQKKERKEEKR